MVNDVACDDLLLFESSAIAVAVVGSRDMRYQSWISRGRSSEDFTFMLPHGLDSRQSRLAARQKTSSAYGNSELSVGADGATF